MRPLPDKLRNKLEDEPMMNRCCVPGCMDNEITWEHAWQYSGRQIGGDHGVEDWWAIIGMCREHHLGDKYMIYLNQNEVRAKDWGKYVTLLRGIEIAKKNYPKKNWEQELQKLEFKLFN